MRLFCEFSNCHCHHYIGRGRCRHCGHGECWHKRSTQFDSVRQTAENPSYLKIPIVLAIFIPEVPPVSPFESDESDYCECTQSLPV